MTFQELNSLFEHPDGVGRSSFQDLRALLEAYPFVSSFHLLYQLGLSNEADVMSDAELQRSVMYAPDRNQLMQLLMAKPVVSLSASVPPVSAPAERVSLSQLSPANPVEEGAAESVVSPVQEPAPMMFADEVNAFLSHFEEAKASKQSAAVAEEMPVRLSNQSKKVDTDEADDEADDSAESDIKADAKPKSEFFTETLAKIYIKQEKFAKAVTIFEKLAAKYPEKREYYEEQVRFLNKLIKYM